MEKVKLTKEGFKRFRKAQGWKRADMAKFLGLSSEVIISYKEHGQRAITKRDELMINNFKEQQK